MSSVRPYSEREDRVLDVPEVLHHRYPEVVPLPAAGGEPEVDDDLPGEWKEHQHRDGAGEEAGGGAFCEDGGIQYRGPGPERLEEDRIGPGARRGSRRRGGVMAGHGAPEALCPGREYFGSGGGVACHPGAGDRGAGCRGREASIGIDMTIVLECHTADYMPVTFLESRYAMRYGDTVSNQGFYEEGRAGSLNRDVHTGGRVWITYPLHIKNQLKLAYSEIFSQNEFFRIKVRTISTYGLHTSCPVRDISPGSV